MSVEPGRPDGLYVAMHRGGEGDRADLPVVIVHGALDRSTSFGRFTRRLADLTVVRYDRRGYGRSQPGASVDLDAHVDDLEAVVEPLAPVVLFGHSVGGVVSLGLASRTPDLVASMLLYECPTGWAPWWEPGPEPEGDPAERAERFMVEMIGRRLWDRLPSGTRDARRAEGPALVADQALVATGRRPGDLDRITVPVLSAAGAETSTWHRRAAEDLAGELPDGRFELVEDADHGIHLSRPRRAEELVRAARDRARDDR